MADNYYERKIASATNDSQFIFGKIENYLRTQYEADFVIGTASYPNRTLVYHAKGSTIVIKHQHSEPFNGASECVILQVFSPSKRKSKKILEQILQESEKEERHIKLGSRRIKWA